MPRFTFELSAEVEADTLEQAEEKIKAGVDFNNIEILTGLNEVVEEDDEEEFH